MVTYPLNLPSEPGFAGFDIDFNPTVGISQSPYDGSQQVQSWPSQFWTATITLPTLNRARRALWQAWVAKLNGIEGTFLMGDPFRQTPQGSAASAPGTPLVNGTIAAQSGSITVDGLPASASGYLKAGDYIQIGTGANAKLLMVQDDVNSDGSGAATINVWPKTRVSIADNAPVIVTGCVGLWRMTQNRQSFAGRRGPHTDYSYSCMEAF